MLTVIRYRRVEPSRLTYIRLHGRNAAQWWDHRPADDRYDYLYSPAELSPFADVARAASSHTRKVLVYFNNHFSSKAPANAAVLKHQLGQIVPGEYTTEMANRYPELRGVVRTRRYCSRFRVQGSGVQGSGSRFKVQGCGFKVLGSGSGFGLEVPVQGSELGTAQPEQRNPEPEL